MTLFSNVTTNYENLLEFNEEVTNTQLCDLCNCAQCLFARMCELNTEIKWLKTESDCLNWNIGGGKLEQISFTVSRTGSNCGLDEFSMQVSAGFMENEAKVEISYYSDKSKSVVRDGDVDQVERVFDLLKSRFGWESIRVIKESVWRREIEKLSVR